MFFKNYFNGLADVLEVKYKSHKRDGINSDDIGELCEIFLKDFLIDGVGDHYKIYRGGNVIDADGKKSSQLDIVLTNKNSLKIFGDKGIYPVETVASVFSITSNLTLTKARKSIRELASIPKQNPSLNFEKNVPVDFAKKTFQVWKSILPFSCVFGFTGTISESWLEKLNAEFAKVKDPSLLPDMIIVNKIGMLEKIVTKVGENQFDFHYEYSDIADQDMQGVSFSKMLFHLYNQSGEQYYMRIDYSKYFSKDF